MRLAFVLILVLIFALPSASKAQDVPGNVYLGVPSILLTSYVVVCLPPDGGVYAFATAPVQPVKSVRFQITWPAGVDHDQGSVVWPGAVDVSHPGDDVWEIEFDGCFDTPGATLILVRYDDVNFHGGQGWMCAYGNEVPRPVWTLCSGETIEGELFDVGPDWMDGCSPYGSYYCSVIPAQSESWGTLKSRY